MRDIFGKNIETFIGCDSEFEQAAAVIFGVPFDSTTSYRPGTRFAGRAVRAESYGLETYSPYQDRDICDISIYDGGDLELPFGNAERALCMIQEYADAVTAASKLPVMIGGEHLATLGTVRALYKKYPDLRIIHFDAHTDLREHYLGERLSHATVMRRIWDMIGDSRIYQFGIRSGEKSEFDFAAEHTFMRKFDLKGLDEAIDGISGAPVYFSLDLDILDPSVFPGTGTPEPGGISFNELLYAVIKLGRLNIVGCDICELSPVYDQSGASTAVACKILREMLLSFIR